MRKRLIFLATLLGFWLFGGVFMIQSYAAPTILQPVQETTTPSVQHSREMPLILEFDKTTLPEDVFIYNNSRKNHRY